MLVCLGYVTIVPIIYACLVVGSRSDAYMEEMSNGDTNTA